MITHYPFLLFLGPDDPTSASPAPFNPDFNPDFSPPGYLWFPHLPLSATESINLIFEPIRVSTAGPHRPTRWTCRIINATDWQRYADAYTDGDPVVSAALHHNLDSCAPPQLPPILSMSH